MTAYSQPQGHG